MIVVWIVLCACFVVSTFYTWKLEQDFKEWSMDINMEFFHNYSKFKED